MANASHVPEVTAQVEQRSVDAERTRIPGQLALGSAWTVSLAPGEGGMQIVTDTYLAPGQTLRSGELLAGVSGRPVIGLELPFKLYRDIRGGDSGTDVEHLQRALGNLGLYGGGIDGDYGPDTAGAVDDLYERLNVERPQASNEALADAQAAQETVNQAKAMAAAAPGDEKAAVAVKAAEDVLAAKRVAALTPVLLSEIVSLPSGEVTVMSIAPVSTELGAETPLAELRSGKAVATARVGVGDKDAFTVGMNVEVQAQADSQITSAGTVTSISEFTQEISATGNTVSGHDVTVKVNDLQGMEDGQNVTVIAGNSEKIEGMAVPVTALRKEGGSTFVVKSGTDARVPVEVKMVKDGYAILDETALHVGDSVIVSQP